MTDMKESLYKSLVKEAKEFAKEFSRKDRAKNFSGETFEVFEIIVLSETSAAVIFFKSSKKFALAFFNYILSGQPYWNKYFPTDSHVFGMEKLPDWYRQIQKRNFKRGTGSGRTEKL